MDAPTAGRTGAEIGALSLVRDESRAIVDDLFRDQKLEWRSGFKQKLGNQRWGVILGVPGAARNANTLSGGALNQGVQSMTPGMAQNMVPNLGPPVPSAASLQKTQELIREFTPPELLAEVTRALGDIAPTLSKEFAASITPLVGVLTPAASSVWSAYTAIKTEFDREEVQRHQRSGLTVDEPARAIEAVDRILYRESTFEALSASIAAAEFGSKLVTFLVDAGTATNAAIGLGANALKFTNILRVIVRDVSEKRAANKAMLAKVDASIFEVCPIVGAYMICCVPTSVLVNAVLERFWEHGWRGEVEQAVAQHVVPLRKRAQSLVQEHRFVIPGLMNYPGLMEVNKEKLKEMMDRKGRTGMMGGDRNDPRLRVPPPG
jgi:hypothetical protein